MEWYSHCTRTIEAVYSVQFSGDKAGQSEMSATSTVGTSNGVSSVPLLKTIAICDTQPVTVEGIRNLLRDVADLKFMGAPESLTQAMEVVQRQRPDVLILDKGFGIQAVLDWLTEIQATGTAIHTG